MRTLPDTAAPADAAEPFLNALSEALPLLVLTGAGISVPSGIPTYRDERGTWRRSQPITHREFLSEARQRQRYWGRSLLGWPAVQAARPTPAHRHLARLEGLGAVATVVTQNVDRLHQRAGSRKVIDLHGRLDRVHCLRCGARSGREELQRRLEALNPQIRPGMRDLRPDGDADLPETRIDTVSVPACERCGGELMPDVVFFGGSIPRDRVAACRGALDRAAGLLVVGSSLQVYSGYRFCRWAREADKPVLIVNPGKTRADPMGRKWSSTADRALETLVRRLEARR